MMFKNVLNAVDHHAAFERGRRLLIQLFRSFTWACVNRSFVCRMGAPLHLSGGFASHRGFENSTENPGHQHRWILFPAASRSSQQIGLVLDAVMEGASLDGVVGELITKGKSSAVTCQAKSAGLSRLGLDPTIPLPEGYALSVSWQKALG